jgi:ATP-dependent helicase HrpA
MESLVPGERDLTAAMAERLFEMTGVLIPQDGWDPEAVPVHLRMNVVVTDPSGRELAVGRDFEAIRRRLGEQARERFAELVTGDPVRPGANPAANGRDGWFERDSVSSWDFGDLSEQVEFARGGVTLNGYPALVEESGSVALRLLDTPESAQQATRAGMRCLFALCARDKVKYLRRKLPGLQEMSLHFVGVGSQSDLVEDLLAAIVDRAFLGDGPMPRTRATFEDRLSGGRERLVDVANELCGLAGVILGTRHEVCKSMSTELPAGAAEALRDIRSQLDHLVYVGFMSHTPYERLQHLPRYLKAIAIRLRKLAEAPDRDRARRADIERLWLMWSQRSEVLVGEQIRDPELETFRWMLEELRVSQFAQELRTPGPVSVKRLEQQWQAVKD